MRHNNTGGFDRFTERARAVLSLAQEEAARANRQYTATEHLLLGLIRESEGVAAKVLGDLGLGLDHVRQEVEAHIVRSNDPHAGEIGLTTPAKRAIELAIDEARRLGHHYIGTEHLLLGLIREPECGAARVLEALGAPLERVRSEVLRILAGLPAGYYRPYGDSPAVNRPHTNGTAQSLAAARREAGRFNHNYIGTEHLLLGLTAVPDTIAAGVLADLGIELAKIRSSVEFIIGRGERQVTGEIGYTPRAKKVLELATDEARRYGHFVLATPHLLLGLVREGEGIAAGVMESLGVNLERVRKVTFAALAAGDITQDGGEEYSGDITPDGREVHSGSPSGQPRRSITWQYLILETRRVGDAMRVHLMDEGEEHRFRDLSLHQSMQTLGSEGWELVGVDFSRGDDKGGALYIFKRPRTA